MDKLLSLPAKELLRKFGSGNHKPGSGSAAALQALLSAALILTVIDLTRRRKPPVPARLLEIETEITNRIYPELEQLCEEDSIIFDKVVALRTARNNETYLQRKTELAQQAIEALVPATDIPVQIGKLAIELGDYATEVFEKGYQSARGDSGVALNSAVSTAAGCLAIIELNLLSFNVNGWTRKIRSDVGDIKHDHEILSQRAAECLDALRKESRTKSFHQEIADLTSGKWTERRLTLAAIEEIAKQTQNVLWEYRDFLWQQNTPDKHIDILRPEVVIEKILGYQLRYATLGQITVDDETFEGAGEIDKKEKVVLVSRAYAPEVQNFTAAHELGHALLHHSMEVLHRDKPSDGSSPNRDLIEVQADKFAAYFLMPAKQVRSVFQELFGLEKFVLNQDMWFGLNQRDMSLQEFRRRFNNPRELERRLTRLLASAEYFNGKTFNPLAKIFSVSVGAMAIRLTELELIEF